jgi:hypothetical protein
MLKEAGLLQQKFNRGFLRFLNYMGKKFFFFFLGFEFSLKKKKFLLGN